MRILVTGASGHLGHKLSTHLVAAGHQVMGLDIQSRSDGPFPVIAADLSRHSETWTAAFAGQDAIIHLAADRAPEALVRAVKLHVDAFTGDAPKADDVTILAVRRPPAPV